MGEARRRRLEQQQQQAAMDQVAMDQSAAYHQSLLENHSPEEVAGILNRIGLDDPPPKKIADIALAAAGLLFICMNSMPEAEHHVFMGGVARHVALLAQQSKRQKAAAPAPDATVIRARPADYPM